MPLNPPLSEWRNQTVWLVGASTGIGRATALALARAGARVVVSARTQSTLDELLAELRAAGSKDAQAIALDVVDAKAVHAAWHQVSAHGSVALVMFCAGIYNPLRAQEFKLHTMRQHMDVNYNGALHVLDAVLPSFLAARRGHISLVSSVAGYRGLPKSLAYGPTKAALTNLAEALYIDVRDDGLGVSLISPGFVETPLTAQNQFKMPALISPEKAAEAIVKGWADGEFEIHFPKRFTRWMKLLRSAPYRAYFAATRQFTGL
jgi:short-subunit dehydrogenase